MAFSMAFFSAFCPDRPFNHLTDQFLTKNRRFSVFVRFFVLLVHVHVKIQPTKDICNYSEKKPFRFNETYCPDWFFNCPILDEIADFHCVVRFDCFVSLSFKTGNLLECLLNEAALSAMKLKIRVSVFLIYVDSRWKLSFTLIQSHRGCRRKVAGSNPNRA